MTNELVERLTAGFVHCRFIADYRVDVIEPHEVEKLYAAANASRDAAQEIATISAEIERLREELKEAEDERKCILHNKRVNDAVQTAFENDEFYLTLKGWIAMKGQP